MVCTAVYQLARWLASKESGWDPGVRCADASNQGGTEGSRSSYTAIGRMYIAGSKTAVMFVRR